MKHLALSQLNKISMYIPSYQVNIDSPPLAKEMWTGIRSLRSSRYRRYYISSYYKFIVFIFRTISQSWSFATLNMKPRDSSWRRLRSQKMKFFQLLLILVWTLTTSIVNIAHIMDQIRNLKMAREKFRPWRRRSPKPHRILSFLWKSWTWSMPSSRRSETRWSPSWRRSRRQ